MARSKRTLNPIDEVPQDKTDVTKPFMIAYMQSEKATAEDIAWFKSVVSNPENQKDYINKFTKEPYRDIDIPKVRKAFCARFYPNLNKKKGKETFIDIINSL